MKKGAKYKHNKRPDARFSLMSYCMVFSLLFGLCSWKTNKAVKDSSASIEKEQVQKPIEAKKDSSIAEKPEILELVINIEEEEKEDAGNGESELFVITNELPEFPGGDKALYEYINKNLKYPKEAIEADIEGLVVVRFNVDKEGEINNIEVVKSLGSGCDEEVIRVVREMPKWTPGKIQDQYIDSKQFLPISFRFTDK